LKDASNGFFPNIDLCLRDDYFEEHIKYISQVASIVSLNEIVSNISTKKRTKHLVGISFDDGYRDNLELALPILEKYNVPATIFIASGFADRISPLWWEELGFILTHANELSFHWKDNKYHFKLHNDNSKCCAYLELNRLFKKISVADQKKLLEVLRPQCPVVFNYEDLLLNWDELKKLSKHPLISLGCHTVNHPILSNETEQAALLEMTACRERIADKIGLTTDLFAYPSGGSDEAGMREFKLAEKAGFKASFTTRTGHIFKRHQSYMQCLPRIILDYTDSLDGFKWKLSGFDTLHQNNGRFFITD
jgi:peptidoglycan/xylan/chitin deacetylase (PgdA/CDA1 family)